MIQNAAHLHLIVNHWPLILIPLAALILAWGEWKGSGDLKKLGFILFIAGGIAAGVAYKSGESGEDVVEHMPGVSETLIEEHEEAAEPAAVAAGIAALLALVGLGLEIKKSASPRALTAATLLAAIAAAALLGRAATLGGQVLLAEVRAAGASGSD